MTVASAVSRVSYSGNGSTTAFAVPFYFLENAHLRVVLRSSAGVETVQTITTNYTVTGAGNPAGGTVNMIVAPASGETLVILRDVPETQETDYTANDPFPAESHERALDKLTMITQQISEESGRAIKIPETETSNTTVPISSVRGNKLLGFAAGGDVTLSSKTITAIDAAVDTVETLAAATPGSSAAVSHIAAGTGAVATTVQAKLRESVSVLDFGADPTGVADSTTAFNNAIATGKRVYVPEGTYKCNATINKKTIIYGDGSTASIIKPFDDSIAALTYTFSAITSGVYAFWTYHSEIRDIGFFSNSSKVGIGFTFAKTNPADYATNDEYAQNVKFYGCFFKSLDKGVQFPFGNIGSEFYSCSFQSNKYGVYTLSNKFGGIMHAGNKYFYGGEMSYNDCAVYIHNTTDGFGSIKFDGTIFETNSLGLYCYTNTDLVTPVSFKDTWWENNSAASVTIDSWSGSTKSTQTVAGGNTILDGDKGSFSFKDSFFAKCQLKATNAQVLVESCRSERDSGLNGGPSTVTGANSVIIQNNCFGDGGPAIGNGIYSTGFTRLNRATIDSIASSTTIRYFTTIPRSSRIADYGPSLAFSAPLTTSAVLSGTFNLTGSVVSDGIIYDDCNEFTRAAFASTEYIQLATPNSSITTSIGYYVFTIDVKVISGSIRVFVWDRSLNQFAGPMLPSTEWQTFASIGYANGAFSQLLDFSGTGVDATWRVSAYQIHRFNTYAQAQAFLASGVFAES